MTHAFKSQHLGGRGRWISDFEASLVYKMGSRMPGLYRENCLKKTRQNNNSLLILFWREVVGEGVVEEGVFESQESSASYSLLEMEY